MELALAVYVVLRHARTSPGLAAAAFAVVSFKVTWALPLLVLMAAAGWHRACPRCRGGAGRERCPIRGATAVRRATGVAPGFGDEHDLRPLLMLVITTTILTSVYHQPYSMLVVFLPLAFLARGRPTELAVSVRWLSFVLLTIPMVNFVATKQGLRVLRLAEGEWWILLTSVNGLALLAAWGVAVTAAFRVPSEAATSSP